MATVRASCGICGDVELTTREVQVQVCSATNEGTYSFLCPSCRLIVNKPAEDRVVELLVSAGVKVVNWDLPAELTEPKSGPPITYDDLLAFHFELSADDWLEHVIAGGGPGALARRRPSMSWAWLVPLAVGGLGAALCATLTRAVQREAARVRLARIDLTEMKPRLRGTSGSYRPGPFSPE